jgi:glycosyltransferase involved in cell wall biosynthesis
MKNILIISYHYPPINTAGVYRIMGFSKHLYAHGWKPIVVSVKNPYGVNFDRALLSKIPEHVTVYRTHSFEYGRLTKNILSKTYGNQRSDTGGDHSNDSSCTIHRAGRLSVVKWILSKINKLLTEYVLIPDTKVGWLPTTLVRAFFICMTTKVDIIYTTSPPHSSHLIGLLLKKLTGKKWVADFRDLWTEKPLLLLKRLTGKAFLRAGSPKTRVEERMHGYILRVADAIIANTKGNRELLLAKYPSIDAEKVSVINNGFDREDSENCDYDYSVDPTKPLKISYVGEIYPGMADTLLLALKEMKEEDPEITEKLRIQVVGLVAQDQMLLMERYNLLEVVQYLGFVSYRDSIRQLFESDVLLFLLPHEYGGWVPSKLYNYITVKKPILAIVPRGDASEIIKQTNTGICVDPMDIQGIRNAINDFLIRHRDGGLRIEPNFDRIDQYDRVVLTRKLVGICDQLRKPSK